MPVFVEWKWQENTKSFLVIFHFIDDFSSPNLRIKRYEEGKRGVSIETPIGYIENPKGAWMTWAPSHLELGLLMELLSYANIVNGLKPFERAELKEKLEGRRKYLVKCPYSGMKWISYSPFPEGQEIKNKMGKDKKTVVYFDEPNKDIPLRFCVEICEEYIDYLKNLLKQYLK